MQSAYQTTKQPPPSKVSYKYSKSPSQQRLRLIHTDSCMHHASQLTDWRESDKNKPSSKCD
eukprot:scaffold4505_cov165-Ochromonas_danica.AAC.10